MAEFTQKPGETQQKNSSLSKNNILGIDSEELSEQQKKTDRSTSSLALANLDEKANSTNPNSVNSLSGMTIDERKALLKNEGKVSSVTGATEAVRQGKTGLLPHPKEIVGDSFYNEHLGKFKDGAARFETPFIAAKSKAEWGFGKDYKFLTTKGEADKVEQESQKEESSGDTGIWHMEKEFGAPQGRWVDKKLGGQQDNPKNQMVRYDFPKPEEFELDMAKGNEIDAFKDEWVAGGKTLGGMNEAVIKKIDKERFLEELANAAEGLIKEKEVPFPTTEKFKLDGSGKKIPN
jgi:hypothetical protein